jgi:hypothetical protein
MKPSALPEDTLLIRDGPGEWFGLECLVVAEAEWDLLG